MSNNVYVIGTDMIRFGRFENATPPGLAAQAALLALDDAGLSIKDIQAVYSGNCGETMVGQRMLQLIGQTGVPVVNVTNACATGATAFTLRQSKNTIITSNQSGASAPTIYLERMDK